MYKYDKGYLSKRFIIRSVCLALVFVCGVVFAFIILEPFWLETIQNKIIFNVDNLTERELKILQGLITSNKIHTADFVFERLIQFYEHIITILVSVSAFLGIIGYLYIKNSHQRDIYDSTNSLFNSEMGLNLLRDLIQTKGKDIFDAEFKKSLNDGELKTIQVRTSNAIEEIEGMLKRLEIIENQFEKNNYNTSSENVLVEDNIECNNLEKNLSSNDDDNIAVEVDTAFL